MPQQSLIKEKIKLLLNLLGFEGNIEEKQMSHSLETIYNINTVNKNDSGFLIGQKGVNLRSLQHLVRLLVSKEAKEKTHFLVDVNNYIQENHQRLIQQAQMAAEEAINKHKTIILPPMTAYQRRLIHLELKKNDAISTESIGEKTERKIVIKPVSEIL